MNDSQQTMISNRKIIVIEFVQYTFCCFFHILYAYFCYPKIIFYHCIICVLAFGSLILLSMIVFQKNTYIQQVFAVTLSICTIFIVGYIVRTMEFGFVTYLVVSILLGLLDMPILNFICIIESDIAMILAYALFHKTALSTMNPLLYFGVFSISTAAMYTVYYIVKQYNNQLKMLESQQKELIEIQQSKDEFFANMSHEIRTPMNAIVGLCELTLREPELTPVVSENVSSIQKASHHLLSIINDILDFSKLESQKMSIAHDSYKIVNLIDDVMMIADARKGNKGIELLSYCDPKMPCELIGDEQRLLQILTNLLTNAIKFTKEGIVMLTISFEKVNDTFYLKATVKDTGIGITENNIKKLFTSFSQVDTKKNRSVEGTGLGLAICKRLLTLMDGTIEVKSTYGEGSSFSFSVPQQIANITPVMPQIEQTNHKKILVYCNPSLHQNQKTCSKIIEELDNLLKHMHFQHEIISSELDITHIFYELKNSQKPPYDCILISYAEYKENWFLLQELSHTNNIYVIQSQHQELPVEKGLNIVFTPYNNLTFYSILMGISKPDTPANTQAANEFLTSFVAPKAKILAVDDNIINLKIIRGLLKPYQIQVDTVESANQCYEALQSRDYDMILMDHMMPEIDGVSAAEFIRQQEASYYKTLPIIALTANYSNDVEQFYLEHGFQGYIAKPINIKILETIVRKWIPDKKIISCETDSENENIAQSNSYTISSSSYKNIINQTAGMKYLENDISLYFDIVSAYYEDYEEKTKQLSTALLNNDFSTYEITAHTIKSTSKTIGANETAAIFEQLELAAQTQNLSFIESSHEQGLILYHKTYVEAKKIINEREIELKKNNEPNIERSTKNLKKNEFHLLLHHLEEPVSLCEYDDIFTIINQTKALSYQEKNIYDMLADFTNAVEHFDFDVAQTILQQLMQIL